MKISTVWKILLVWFAIVLIIFFIAKEFSIFSFGIVFVFLLGVLPWKFRNEIRKFFVKIKLNSFKGFFLVAFLITAVEETICYLMGNKVAYPVLWIDILLVFFIWLGWFGSWYFFISKKYLFTNLEMILASGLPGVLYEYVAKPEFLANPLGVLIAFPLASVIYSVIFIFPSTTLNFSGKNNSWTKWLVAMFLPFAISLPLVIIAFVVLKIFGIVIM